MKKQKKAKPCRRCRELENALESVVNEAKLKANHSTTGGQFEFGFSGGWSPIPLEAKRNKGTR